MGDFGPPMAVGNRLCLICSVLTLIPLALIYAGCTSPSSPPSLYFMKIDLTDFAGIGGLHLRSVGSPVADMVHKERGTLNMVDDVPIIPAKADSPVIQPRISISSVADKIHAQIPDFGFYTVGLWGYCQGKSGSSAFVKCSTPSRSLSVDLQSVFHSVSDMLPNAVQSALGMVKSCSLAAVIAYLLGGASTVLVSLLNVIWMVSERRNKGHSTKARRRLGASILLFSMVACISTAVASGVATTLYAYISHTINHDLQSWGAKANVGYLLIPAWLSVALSFLAFLAFLPSLPS